jgi:TolB-like protein/AraC-like DNA-binding protein/Tfp pilus assembly protein PilF
MSDSLHRTGDFSAKITTAIEENISNEQFGVSELAHAMNMSRSNLLRKVKKETNLSVSQFISQVRLRRAMEMLEAADLNVSQVSHEVGFSSTSYFIKCFRERYGYPPGEVGKRRAEIQRAAVAPSDIPSEPSVNSRKRYIFFGAALLLPVVAGLFFFRQVVFRSGPSEKSIAVLPFKNDSNDSTNVYLINGIMEATLNNLQKIEDLKVTSRTSVERYRNTSRTIPEMAAELGVRYFVEGSGQKIDDRILLNIQLIDGSTDRHLWAKQYRHDLQDIFELQEEIAKNIAEAVEVIITPEEEQQIKKEPTDNPVAYDFYLKGKELFYQSTGESLERSIPYFKQAVEADNKFALAYANAAMVYYYLDMFQVQKKYGVEITGCAEKAMRFDPELVESNIAQGLSYAHKSQFDRAVSYLEEALEYDPNSGLAVHFLTEFYSIHIPNTARYLEYAIKGVQLDITSHDSVTTGFKYFHLGNALVQSGFVDEALMYVNKSLAYDSNNIYSGYVRAWITLAKNQDLYEAKRMLLKVYEKDTTRLDVVNEVAKVHYYLRDYKNALKYYQRCLEIEKALDLDLFKHEYLAMGLVFREMGKEEESEALILNYKEYADSEKSIYKNLHLSVYYAYKGDVDQSLVHMRLFSAEENWPYWLLFYEIDPALESVKHHPEFKTIMRGMESGFWNRQKDMRAELAGKGLLQRY